jgi:hypothetical protein
MPKRPCAKSFRLPPKKFRHRVFVGHPLTFSDPVLAQVVDDALGSSTAEGTQCCYKSALKLYLGFCRVRKLAPFPVDSAVVASFCVWACMSISVASLKVYLAAVRSSHIDEGYRWTIPGDPLVARAVRYVKRRYGMADKALKVPISLATLFRMCCFLVGWPTPSAMCQEDLLFVAASSLAIVGFLRGGEFLFSQGGGRPLLKQSDVVASVGAHGALVSVRVAQPKARWWLQSVVVPCFDTGVGSPLNPSVWLAHYRRRSAAVLAEGGPAFAFMDGSPLTKRWMVDRTSTLLGLAGVCLLDAGGQKVSVKASSWRAGGVQSAKVAGLSDALIKALGRWSSTAWCHYLFASHADLQAAVKKMWKASRSSPSSLVVGSFAPSGLFEDAI